MKTREDFVSNSSSSSFIVAVNSSYSIADFSSDLARKCVNKDIDFHNPELEHRNKTILDFCLNTYELLFLGEWKLYTKEHIVKFADKDSKNELGVNDSDYDYYLKYIDQVQQIKSGKIVDRRLNSEVHRNWILSEFGRNFIDDNKDIHVLNDVSSYGIIVDNAAMRRYFNNSFDDGKKKECFKYKMFREFAENNIKEHKYNDIVEIYQITKQTVDNTKFLISCGEELKFDSWEKNLDDLEQRLAIGEKIFSIRIAHQGDGYGTYYIYNENDMPCIDELAAQILYSECI